jgi:DnaD/phage-associated family protein
VIENPKLSWKAKGLLAYLLSRPDNWTVRFGDLVKRAPDGAHTIRGAMKELRKAGHVKVVAEREGGRVKQWIYTVHESPDGDFQQVENLEVEKQQVEKRALNNKDLSNKDLSNKKEIDNAQSVFDALSLFTGGLNSETPRFVDTWLEKHTVEWILKAVSIAKDKGARSVKYVDSILIGWEANGYPKTREQQVSAKKKPATVAQSGDRSKYVEGKYAQFIEH